MELWQFDVTGARKAIVANETTSQELVGASLERIRTLEPVVQAWAYLDEKLAFAAAAEAELGAERTLAGVPCGIKDIFNTRDMPTGMGSPAWADFTPGNDARAVFNARRAGSVVIGKTVTAEFAVHAPGKTKNPYDAGRSPGTSSSGSAVAVACGMVPWALGSQTAGSVVRPASYCGVYGYKPSYGLIPRTGMLKTTDTLDQVGFFSRSPRDLRILLDTLRVHGDNYPLVSSSLDRTQDDPLPRRPLRIGLVSDSLWTWNLTTEEVRKALHSFAAALEAAGHRVETFECPSILSEAHALHGLIYDRCIAYYFARESAEGTLVSSQIMEMVERGRQIPLSDYTEALDAQLHMQEVMAASLRGVDLLLMPSTAGPAPRVGGPEPDDASLIWSLLGVPALSLPAFLSMDGMPFGAQLVSGKRNDYLLLNFLERLAAEGLVHEVDPVTPGETLPSRSQTEALAGRSVPGRVLT